MQTIHLFDFDGTITSKDSLILFLRTYGSKLKLWVAAAMMAPLIVLVKWHLFNNGRAKEILISFYAKGDTLEHFQGVCNSMPQLYPDVLRPKAIEKLRELQAKGERCIVVTASIKNWVKPFLERELPNIEYITTEVEICNQRLTGRFANTNCFGPVKRQRLEELFPNREGLHFIAYGDSAGDAAMFAFADEHYFRPFE